MPQQLYCKDKTCAWNDKIGFCEKSTIHISSDNRCEDQTQIGSAYLIEDVKTNV